MNKLLGVVTYLYIYSIGAIFTRASQPVEYSTKEDYLLNFHLLNNKSITYWSDEYSSA